MLLLLLFLRFGRSSHFAHIFACFIALFIFGYMECLVKSHRLDMCVCSSHSLFHLFVFFCCKFSLLTQTVLGLLCKIEVSLYFIYSVLCDSVVAITFYFLWSFIRRCYRIIIVILMFANFSFSLSFWLLLSTSIIIIITVILFKHQF